MKKILLPTDFSALSVNAFRYAFELAKLSGASIEVAHVYHPGYELMNPHAVVSQHQLQEAKTRQLERFTKVLFQEEAGQVSVALEVNTCLAIGFAGEELVDRSTDYDLIVMSTTGEGGPMEKIFGSVSSHVAQNAHCPVLLVPDKSTFKPFREILFASNYASWEESMVHKLLTLFQIEKGNIHIVHVDKKEKGGYLLNKMQFEQVVRKTLPDLGLRMVDISCDTAIEGLDTYAHENNIDLLVMCTRHRNAIDRFFHKSFTKRMVLHATMPILVLHFNPQ